MTRLLALILLALPLPALAYPFLTGYEEAPTVAAALERVKAQPDKHVLIYFDSSEFCGPCKNVRAILNSAPVRDQWRPNYVVVNIDLFAPTAAEREVIDQVRVSWPPVLVFLDGNGRRVAYSRQVPSDKEALRLNEFVSQRQYAMSAIGRYTGQDFDSGRMRRLAAEALAVPGTQRIDDRPRLRDVTAQKAERLSGSDLRQLLPGRRMHKENQEWFLTLDLRERNLLEASARRKDGRGEMRGAGKWYITRKGKFCLELTARDVDENWCRHVFRAGDTYYVTKDLRPERLAYRFTLQ